MLLIKHGGNVSARNDVGNTPLHMATLNEDGKLQNNLNLSNEVRFHILDDNKVAKLLLKSGTNLHAKNNAGKEPLDDAVERSKIFRTFKFCDFD